jgi:hypothetical protein
MGTGVALNLRRIYKPETNQLTASNKAFTINDMHVYKNFVVNAGDAFYNKADDLGVAGIEIQRAESRLP